MEKIYQFQAELKGAEGIDGAYIEFPYDVTSEFGTNGRVPIVATFDGVTYRGQLANMGGNCHIVGVLKAIRAQIGKQVGDTIDVSIQKDTTSRLKPMPPELLEALTRHNDANEFFQSLTDAQKNKFSDYITSAKQEKTKQSRLEKVIIMLKNKEKIV